MQSVRDPAICSVTTSGVGSPSNAIYIFYSKENHTNKQINNQEIREKIMKSSKISKQFLLCNQVGYPNTWEPHQYRQFHLYPHSLHHAHLFLYCKRIKLEERKGRIDGNVDAFFLFYTYHCYHSSHYDSWVFHDALYHLFHTHHLYLLLLTSLLLLTIDKE